jgi:endonuclease VIII
MEGPSLFLAREQLKPLKGQRVVRASGDTRAIDPAILEGRLLKDVFAWGKHLILQFDDFALRFHFLMFGSFEARVEGAWVTGDYRRTRMPRLALVFSYGEFRAYSCSVRLIESKAAARSYDRTIDIMSPAWDEVRVRRLLRAQGTEEIADALLDQDLFAGVGNIIKNEVLAIARVRPTRRVSALSPQKVREVVRETRAFSKQFYRWRKDFVLLKNLRTHRKKSCRYCGGPLVRAKTGKRQRWSYWCPRDQL